jgi:hypothetical protein
MSSEPLQPLYSQGRLLSLNTSFSAVGLLIEDPASERMCMLAILCGGVFKHGKSFSLARPPSLAMDILAAKDIERRVRFCEPLVGEVLNLARGLAGGMPIRNNDLVQERGLPAIVITKKVTSAQWPSAVHLSRQWLDRSKHSFGNVIEETVAQEVGLNTGPGSLEDSSLSSFRGFVCSVADRLTFERSNLKGCVPLDQSRFLSKPRF